MNSVSGFVPPPYPHDRLKECHETAAKFDGGAIDLSIGVPCDPPPGLTPDLNMADAIRKYPPSFGTEDFRQACASWLNDLPGVEVSPDLVRATLGSKEFVAGLPHYLKLRDPSKDTVLYPEVSYPSYAMGATLAGLRAVPVRVNSDWQIDVSTIDPADAARAICLWVNTPGNPAGAVDDLSQVVAWGRENNVTVVSDECYIAFTWEGEPRSVLQSGTDGVLAVHSLSKRSNYPGLRIGFYAGEAGLIDYLGEVRKHAGFMPLEVSQIAGIAALADEDHVQLQRLKYLKRMQLLINILKSIGIEANLPAGGFYLWVKSNHGDGWDLTRRLASELGVIVSPGDFYGEAGQDYVRIAAVQNEEKLELLHTRI